MRTAEKLRLLKAMSIGLNHGTLVETLLDSPTHFVHGEYHPEPDVVIVNPVPDALNSLFHELLHRRYPTWSEARVIKTAHRLVSAMSVEEMREWYTAYKKKARRRRAPVEETAE